MIGKNNFVSIPQNFDEPKKHSYAQDHKSKKQHIRYWQKKSSNSLLDQHWKISKKKSNRNQLYTLKTCNMTITFLKYI